MCFVGKGLGLILVYLGYFSRGGEKWDTWDKGITAVANGITVPQAAMARRHHAGAVPSQVDAAPPIVEHQMIAGKTGPSPRGMGEPRMIQQDLEGWGGRIRHVKIHRGAGGGLCPQLDGFMLML